MSALTQEVEDVPTTTLDPTEDAAWREIIADPVKSAQVMLGFQPWSKQQEILQSVDHHKRTAVRSGNGVGKTATAAAVALLFLFRHPKSTVVSTAPGARQVEQLLWREIRKLYARAANGETPAKLPLGGRCLTTRLELAEDWFAIGYSASDTDPERFQGFHSDHILFIVDEASGVSDPIFEAIEGSLANENAKILLIGNPTQATGEFHRAFKSSRSIYHTIHISAYDSPNFTGEAVSDDVRAKLVSPSWVEDMHKKWGGERSPAFQVRVLGEFSRDSDNSVLNLAAVEAAMDREPDGATEPRILSCDVARFGSDFTVIALRRGNTVEILDVANGQDTMETVGKIKKYGNEYRVLKAVIDDTGVGGGVTDRLRELGTGFGIDAYNSGERAGEPDEYPNRRSEAWFVFGEKLGDISLPRDEDLVGDLTAPIYKLDSQARRVVEPKDQTKKKLGRSPDRADAVLMLFATHTSTGARSVMDRSTIPRQKRDPRLGGTIGQVGGTGRSLATTGW